MFSRYFHATTLRNFLNAAVPSPEEVHGILRKGWGLDLSHIAKLLLITDEDSRTRVIEAAVRRRSEKWQNRLFLVPPLYISDGDPARNGCQDYCLYCPWRHGNVPTGQLVRLSADEVRAETTYLLENGYGDVELVAATDPRLFDGKYAARMVHAAKEAGARNVGINFFPLGHIHDYKALANAGSTFAIVWQETYDEDVYRRMHPQGPKANMHHRLDAHDRALQGGIKTVGIAFLGGLTDWRFDALATISHARYLHSVYGANIIFGMPRWKSVPSIPMHVAPSSYDNNAYEFVGAIYSLAMPEALPWFSTREDFDLSARCAKGGGCIFTLDCSTVVGGYTRGDGFAQFPVHSMPLNQGTEWLRERGFDPKVHLPW